MNNNFEGNSMSEVMDQIDKSMERVHNGDLVEGEVITVTDSEAIVNIGYIMDGIIKKSNICNEDENLKDILKVGDKIHACVVKVNDGEGNVLLSKKKADEILAWDELKSMFDKETVFEIKVNEVVKGGVITYFKGIRLFVPASQISISFVKDLNEYLNKSLNVKVIEFDKNKNKVVLSGREVEKDEADKKKNAVLESLQKGEKRSGVVKRLVKFGAFVDLGGIDGLIHNNDLSWKRINNPSEVVSIGDKVEVYVLDFDKEKGRISLGLKDVEADPWNKVTDNFKIDQVVDGKVVRLLDFGAVVELESGVEGLVHVSEISEENIGKPSQVLNIGDSVKVKILNIKPAEKRMSLSIKEAANSNVEELEKYNDGDEGNFLFADLLKKFK